jgi:hypothetical protein
LLLQIFIRTSKNAAITLPACVTPFLTLGLAAEQGYRISAQFGAFFASEEEVFLSLAEVVLASFHAFAETSNGFQCQAPVFT